MTRTVGDLWDGIGSLEELESAQLLARLFIRYEERLEKDPEDLEAHRFFDYLGSELTLVTECNLNRR
ncbi:hypothetical protein [Desulfopila sp. IMCC35008]|uniref:hypothetical protein n=1 Tax=Desulfopila sp. IMCC35008 TaxID=2653858 RepID=UPI0013D17855|nr:hypothetical protein [Desulfopila sp. IMCC35008]